jgi:ubiquinone biosynthesis protein UbiJ
VFLLWSEKVTEEEMMLTKLGELKKSFSKDLTNLKRENTLLKKRIEQLENAQITKEKITKQVIGKLKLDSKLSDMRKDMVAYDEIDRLIGKHKILNYLLKHFTELEKLSITKKQYEQFRKQVDFLRSETAALIGLKKQLTRLSALENQLKLIGREIPKLKAEIKKIK